MQSFAEKGSDGDRKAAAVDARRDARSDDADGTAADRTGGALATSFLTLAAMTGCKRDKDILLISFGSTSVRDNSRAISSKPSTSWH